MSANYDAIIIFLIYGPFGAIQKMDFRHIVCNSYVFVYSNLLFYKNWKQD